MEIIIASFHLLLPKGFVWQNMGRKYKAMLECFLSPVIKLRLYQANIVKESNPYTCKDSIAEWLITYGIRSTNVESLDKKLIILYASATGGQNIEYFNSIVKKEYPSLTLIQKIETDTIELKGELQTLTEFLMLKDFLDKITPAYIFLAYNVEVLENFGQYANCGLAECGAAMCGYDESEALINKKIIH